MGEESETPVWQTVLEGIPPQFHGDLEPKLQEFTNNFQQQIGQVHETYKPWKQLAEANIDPEQVGFALNLVQAIEQDPNRVVGAIQEYYKLTPAQQQQVQQQAQQQQQQQTPSGDQPLDPRVAAELQAIKQQNELLAQVALKNYEAQQAKEQDALLEAEMTKLKAETKEKYGFEMNEKAVLGYAQGMGVDIGKAAEAWYADVMNLLSQQSRPAPRLLGSGGGLPSVKPDFGKMSGQEFNKAAVSYLDAMLGG